MNEARGNRGQAEGVGVVLLTAIVILGVGTFGAFYLGTLDPGDGANADLQVVAVNDTTDATHETTLTVTHAGGEPIDDGRVLLQRRGESYALPDPFEEGEAWNTSFTGAPVGSRLHVLVVENDTNSVVFDSRVTVRDVTTAAAAPDYVPPEGDDGGGDDVSQPGFPYLDKDGDWKYDESNGDVELSWSQLENGYTADDGDYVVIPSSADADGEKSLSGLDVTADGIYVGLNLVVDTNRPTRLNANTGRLRIEGISVRNDLQSANSMIELSGGTVEATGSELRSKQRIDIAGGRIEIGQTTISNAGQSANGQLTVRASGDALVATGASITSKSSIVLESAGGVTDATGATIRNDQQNANGQIVIRSSADAVVVTDATIQSKADVILESSAAGVTAVRTTIQNDGQNANGNVQLTAGSGDVDVNDANVRARYTSSASVTGGTLFVEGTEIRSDSSPGTLQNQQNAPVVGCPAVGDVSSRPNGQPDCTSLSVSLSQPTGGETFTGGTTETIRWTAEGGETSVTGVNLEYSTDGGSTWSVIVSGTPNDGAYDWTVPDIETDQARIRATATDEGGNTATDQNGDVSINSGGTESPPSSISGVRVEDNNGAFDVSYDVSTTARFDRVEITFDNSANEWSDRTRQSTDPRTVVRYTQGGIEGDTFEISLRVYDTNGVVMDERTVTDVVDGTNPNGNDDLSRPSSPTLSSATVEDTSKTNRNRGSFQARYKIDDPDREFQRIEITFENADQSWATTTSSSTKSTGSVTYGRAGTAGERYEIVFSVIDTDGILVDQQVITDVTDGENP